MDFKKSLEEIEKLILDLQEENKTIPILVEGDKDVQALRKLGVKGKIISINMGKSLSDFCDGLVKDYKNIIILTDWDRKGGHLCQIIRRNLEGRVNLNTKYREFFARYSMIKTVEGLPSWIDTMKEKLNLI
jgi:5S rRNA maturation endonuclease (ribonuclease M5)